MDSVATVDKLADTIASALCCVSCNRQGVDHVVEIKGLRVVYLGWCGACFENLGGVDGYQSLLAEIIRQRWQFERRN